MNPELTLNLLSYSFEVKAYDLFALLGAVAVFGGSFWFARRAGLVVWRSMLVLAFAALAVFVGSRALHVATNVEAYRAAPQLVWSLDLARLSLFGGIVLAVLVAAIVARLLRVEFWRLADAVVIPFGVGIALVRVGCFLNGCCFGRETDLPWGVTFPILSIPHQHQLASGAGSWFVVHAVHPTQLYELLAALIAVGVAAIIMKRNSNSGVAALAFTVLFVAYRLAAFSIRPIPLTFDAPATTYPIMYVVLLAISVPLLALRYRRKN